MQPILQQLMRHASIDTTLRFYVGKNADTAVAAVRQSAGRPKGNTPGDSAYPNRHDGTDASVVAR
jgi:hypothetical protein